MPLYEHECKDCDTRFEVRRGMKDGEKAEPKCPDCGSTNTRRVFSLFGWKISAPGQLASTSNSCAPSPRKFG